MTPEQRKRIERKLVLTYLLVAILTFGAAFNLEYNDEIRAPEYNSFIALFCAALWPLYWSTKVFSFLRP